MVCSNPDPNIYCSDAYIQVLGYQRTLQASDLYKLDTSRESGVLAAKLEGAWQRRVRAAADWNARLKSGELRPSLFKRVGWAISAISRGKDTTWSQRRAAFQKHWRESAGRKEASLTWALNDVFSSTFWIGGAFKAWIFLIHCHCHNKFITPIRSLAIRHNSWVLLSLG